MENSPLDRFKSIINMGNGSFENYIRGIIEEPLFVHPCYLVPFVSLVYEFIILTALGRIFRNFQRFFRLEIEIKIWVAHFLIKKIYLILDVPELSEFSVVFAPIGIYFHKYL